MTEAEPNACQVCGKEFPPDELVLRSERRPNLDSSMPTPVLARALAKKPIWVCREDADYLDSLRGPVGRFLGRLRRRRELN